MVVLYTCLYTMQGLFPVVTQGVVNGCGHDLKGQLQISMTWKIGKMCILVSGL